MDIDRSARISFGARLDKTNPRGVHIGKESYVASGAIVFAHDFSRSLHADTRIGERCFIGANAIIMCGVRIGDEVVVGSGDKGCSLTFDCCGKSRKGDSRKYLYRPVRPNTEVNI